MKQLLITLLLGTTVLTAQAQRQRRPVSPADTLHSVVTGKNGMTTFSIYAPEAKSVSLAADFSGLDAKFTKGDNGIWTATAKVSTDAYRYHFVVDGVKVIDPRTPLYTESIPVTLITNGEDMFWDQKDVMHGPVSQISYKSTTTGQVRSMHVWVPADQSATKPLPVLYLIHGAGDNDASWTSIGCAGNILDNLYAEGKIKPMIVVMPHGGMDTNKFPDELFNDIMPRVAQQYRVKKGSDNTAIAGLSMGGLETLNCIMAHPDAFGYINVMSSGWFGANEAALSQKTQQLREIAPVLKKTAHLLRFTMGTKADFAYESCQNTLKCFDEVGLKYDYSETPGGHSWHVWRYDLRDLAPQLFKK